MLKISNELQILYLIYAAISLVIYVPLSIYGIRRYLKYHNHILLTKRYSKLALLTVIILLCIIILGSAILIIASLHRADIAYWLMHPVFILVIVQMFCFLLRMFLNYYDMNHAKKMTNNKWKVIINESSATRSWFLKNKAKYGNVNYWIKYLIVATIFTILFFYSVLLVYPSFDADTFWHAIYYENIAAFIPGSCGMCFIAFIRYKTWKLKFHDNIYFGEEIDRGLKAAAIGLICNIIILIIIGLILPSFHLNLDLLYFGFATVLFVFMSVFYFWIHIFTVWVIQKNAKWLNLRHNFKSFSKLHEIIQYDQKSLQSIDNELNLEDVLLSADGFQSLMNDILKNYSMEIVLSQIEITQFQRKVLQYMNADEDLNAYIMELPYPKNAVPQSSIVYGDEALDEYTNILQRYSAEDSDKSIIYELKVRAWLMYKKYIETGAEFEVNIAFATRYQLMTEMNDLDMWLRLGADKNVHEHCMDLLNIFRHVMDEQYKLLGYSFARYKTTAFYKKLQAQLRP